MRDSVLSLARLRHRLERLEPRRAERDGRLFASGHSDIDAALGGGLLKGHVHEIFGDTGEIGSPAGLASLFCLRASLSEEGAPRPFLWLRTDNAQKRAGRLYAAGLRDLGLDPSALLIAVVADEDALLRAAEEAARCSGLCALILECWGAMRRLDLTATRRLMLAAEASGVTVLILRIEGEAVPSAADTRWRVGPAPSVPLEADAPGSPMFELELLRRRGGPPAGPWRVEWDRDQSCFKAPDARALAGSPLSRPLLPMAPGREDAPLRRSG